MLLSPPAAPSLKPVPLNRRLPQRQLGVGRFLLPRRRPRNLRSLGVCMAEMARVGSGSSREFGVTEESDAILGGGGGARRGATRWGLVEARLNRTSKWLIAGCYASAALWKHDALIMWAMSGSVLNSLFSQLLKRMFNHERPSPALRSDPGMPSSHAQSFLYAAMFLILSLFYWLGITYLSIILGVATLALSSYLSWLRVSQRLHTLNQVLVGGIVGAAFGASWFVFFQLAVREAFASSLPVRIAVTAGSAAFCIGFVIYVIRNWFKDE
ncbi:lipid phosphate phosphatase epsilon 1, chloroplastic-like [Oryza brachyantha]|uniref:Phosphatidic acid phosphatase type 2/haloperoxidase domain-containing protein n=1 Tax=Oryza brachyantha TaxID=4533 RepID=J3LG88_ORYBR|nr:lipid phosphate phosphatase epsilon 1, chloroplastic-like [Oryza brachyantha]